MIRIESARTFFLYFIVIGVTLYVIFKIFHYYFPYNYCDYFSASVIQNTLEDVKETKKCVNTLVCKVGPAITENVIEGNDRYVKKDFNCIRKIEPGIWKW